MSALASDPAPAAARRWSRQLRTAIGALAAVILLVIGGVAVAQPFLPPGETHAGTIFWHGYQILHYRTSQYGPFTNTKIPIVKVRTADGTVRTVESAPLFKLFDSAPGELQVRVQEDQNGAPKRIQYHGRWYGAAPPTWFWLGFGAALLAASALLARTVVHRLRARPRLAAGGSAR